MNYGEGGNFMHVLYADTSLTNGLAEPEELDDGNLLHYLPNLKTFTYIHRNTSGRRTMKTTQSILQGGRPLQGHAGQ